MPWFVVLEVTNNARDFTEYLAGPGHQVLHEASADKSPHAMGFLVLCRWRPLSWGAFAVLRIIGERFLLVLKTLTRDEHDL